MIYSLNYVSISGNVASVNIGKTGVGVSAFSMLIAMDQRNNETLWVRVNVYGALAKRCIDHINKSDYVVVTGELMDRKKSLEDAVVLEIRAREVLFGANLMNHVRADEVENESVEKLKINK